MRRCIAWRSGGTRRCHCPYGCALFLGQAFHELGQDSLAVALAGPHDGVCLVVHDDGHVLVSLAVAGLVYADADKAVKAPFRVGLEVPVRSMDAAADRVPLDAHVGRDGALAQPQRHPCHSHVECPRELGARERPRDSCSVDAMLRAFDAGQAVAKVYDDAVVVEGAPQARFGLGVIVCRAAFSADGAKVLLPPVRAQVDDDALGSIRPNIEAQVLNN